MVTPGGAPGTSNFYPIYLIIQTVVNHGRSGGLSGVWGVVSRGSGGLSGVWGGPSTALTTRHGCLAKPATSGQFVCSAWRRGGSTPAGHRCPYHVRRGAAAYFKVGGGARLYKVGPNFQEPLT